MPLDHWFRNELKELVHDTLTSDSALCHQYFRPEAIKLYLEEHMAKRRNHSQRLWALLFFELWLQRWTPTGNS